MQNINIENHRFETIDGVKELHSIIHITSPGMGFDTQLKLIIQALDELMQKESDTKPVFARFFLSDAANQYDKVISETEKYDNIVFSVIEQPPLDGTKIALWVYSVSDIEIKGSKKNNLATGTHNGYTHIWSASMTAEGADSYIQSKKILDEYCNTLAHHGATLADNCIRTWFFVQNVDTNYQGIVKGRNEIFDKEGLTSDTHFIASTGIGGRHANHRTLTIFDAYSISGIEKEQIKYLYAPSHLNPTYEYGVSFERGTSIEYGDRKHVFISGTASINNKGEIVHPGNIEKQVERMWENVETLLKEAECEFCDVAHMLVYLRDIADIQTVKELFNKKFANTPKVFLLAPVCRPGWLIEMECMAIKEKNTEKWRKF